MRDFTVRCVSKKTGNPYTITVRALHEVEAEETAAAEGHMIEQGATHTAATPPVDDSVQREIRAVRAELQDFTHWLGKQSLIKHPISTIAWGIIASGLLLIIITGAVWFAIGALAVAASRGH